MCKHRVNRSNGQTSVFVNHGIVQIPRQGFICEKCGALLDSSGLRPIYDDQNNLVKITSKKT